MSLFKPLDWTISDSDQNQILEWYAPAAGGCATVKFVNGEYIWNLGDECQSYDGGVEPSLMSAMQKAQSAHETEFTRLMEIFLEGDER